MDITQWVKDNKIAAAAIGGGGLLLILHRGHTANVSSSDSTVDGAPADGEHVQLIPVSSGPSETAGTIGDGTTADPSNGGTDGINDTGDGSSPPGLDVPGLGQIPGGVNIGGDLNSPLMPPQASTPDNSDVIAAITSNGAAVSGAIAALAAAGAAARPAGHPGYKTVVRQSAKYGGAVVYHERLSDNKLIPVRPASTKAAEAIHTHPAKSVHVEAHPAAKQSKPKSKPKHR